MKIILAPSAILWLSVLFYLDGKVIVPFFLAAALHEAGHYLALWRMGCPPKRITLAFTGAQMQISPLSYRQELLAAAAGPGTSLALGLVFPLWPSLALCSLILGLFNLVPLPGLDGGRILRCAAMLCFSADTAARICRLAAMLAALGLWGVALYLVLPGGFGLWPLAVAALFLGKTLTMVLSEIK